MKKKLNKKGFAMVETLICAVMVIGMVSVLYNLIIPLVGSSSSRANYDDLDTKYIAYYIKEMIETDSSSVNDITDLTNSPYATNCGNTCKIYKTRTKRCENEACSADSNGEIKYIDVPTQFTSDIHFTNKNELCEFLDSTKLTKNNRYFCNQYVNASHITNMYLLDYDTSNFKKFIASSKAFSRSLKEYVKYMPSHSAATGDKKNNYLRLIVEVEHEATTEFGDKYYTYSSIEVKKGSATTVTGGI